MTTITIFLASSNELEDDRNAFQKFLSEKSTLWRKEKNIDLELVYWENFLDAMAETRLQDKYNQAVKQCDIFVMLFWTKVGMYTEEEFLTAYNQFKANGKPLVYTYFKDAPASNPVQESLSKFQLKLKELGHFKTVYKNTEGLLYHFNHQLDMIYLKVPEKQSQAMALSTESKKKEIIDLINESKFFEAFEELNLIFLGKNPTINKMLDDFVNQPIGYSDADLAKRLKVFTSRSVK